MAKTHDYEWLDEAGLKKILVALLTLIDSNMQNNDTNLKALIKENSDAIAILNGTGEGSVTKQVADAITAIVAGADESLDTLKEIADWITEHAESASAMNSQIITNKTDIAELETLIGKLPDTAASSTIVDYIQEALNAQGVTINTRITELDNRVGDLEAVTYGPISDDDLTTIFEAAKNEVFVSTI